MNKKVHQTETKKKSRNFSYLVLATTILLIAIILIAVFLDQTSYGPGPVDIEVTPDKQFYIQGEEVNFTIYVNNPHNWPVPYPYSVSYIIKKDGVYIASLGGGQITYAEPLPKFPPHSKTLFRLLLMPWNQKIYLNGTMVRVQPGDYTFTVIFYGRVDYGESGKLRL